jgi:hypothetical protein
MGVELDHPSSLGQMCRLRERLAGPGHKSALRDGHCCPGGGQSDSTVSLILKTPLLFGGKVV